MLKTVQDWLAEGEALYQTLVDDQREIELQIELMEEQLDTKLSELNRVASIIGKPPSERRQRTVGRALVGDVIDGYSTPAAANIARALNGRVIR